ncbi:MAG: GIY-YIG nuclease family protein, partial [Chitinophagales bacterium]|nr:GIY-YIG nuclease family protein [Chitinophagales bacterium]
LQSEQDGSFYKGFSENPFLRLEFHNLGKSTFTSKKRPWKIVGILEFSTKQQALAKERKIKKYNKTSLEALIASSQNQISKFLS